MTGFSPLLGQQVQVRDTEGHVTEGELIGFRLMAGARGAADRFEWVALLAEGSKVELRGDLTITAEAVPNT